MKIEPKRIGDLAFNPATYLCTPPEHPNWSIDMYYPNGYYGRDKEFPEDPSDSNYRLDPKYPNCRIHKSCFKNKESCFTIVSFEYDDHEPCWEVKFVGDRPLEYLNTPELRETFWELLKYGNEQLSKTDEEYE